MNLDISIDYIKSLKTIGELQEVYKIVESPSKQIMIAGGDKCKRIEEEIPNTSQKCFTSFQKEAFSLTPLAQDLIDSVEYSPEEQADLNLTKIDGLEETFYIK